MGPLGFFTWVFDEANQASRCKFPAGLLTVPAGSLHEGLIISLCTGVQTSRLLEGIKSHLSPHAHQWGTIEASLRMTAPFSFPGELGLGRARILESCHLLRFPQASGFWILVSRIQRMRSTNDGGCVLERSVLWSHWCLREREGGREESENLRLGMLCVQTSICFYAV